MDMKMQQIPYGQFSMEMRSGKIISIDEEFTSLLGYDNNDVKNGLLFKTLVQDVEYKEIIASLRQQFIISGKACYLHHMRAKNGETIDVCVFIEIQNKLLDGHRVLVVGVANISSMQK